MASDAERNKQIINDFFVGLFNDILLLEERHLKKMGLADLSLSEVHILEAIAQKENPAMGDVAQQVSLTNGTVTTAVKKLEEKGYAERQRDLHDRRIIRVRLSDKGWDAQKQHQAFHQQLVEQLCADTDVVEDETLIRSLKKLQRFFKGLKEMTD